MTSITQKLQLLGNARRTSNYNSILFSHQVTSDNAADKDQKRELHHGHHGHNLTYEQSWQVVDEHQQWLLSAIDEQTRYALATAGNSNIEDVVIGYLADNSPDLLLSVLACMNLTITNSASSSAEKVLPAMINCRWTPLEMERALRPSCDDIKAVGVGGVDGSNSKNAHVTIVLYGVGYERAAKEAMQLMNENDKKHFAVALSLPELAQKYDITNTNNSAAKQESKQQHQHQTNNSSTSSFDNDNTISNADALLLFTSGTSSPKGAKGVRLSHRSLLAQARAKTQQPCNYDDRTRVVATTVPWFHVGGMSSALSVHLAGGCLVFPPVIDQCNSRIVKTGFDPGRVLQSISIQLQEPHLSTDDSIALVMVANTLVVVPAMLHAIAEYSSTQRKIDCKKGPTICFPNVRLILVGGQSIGNGKLYHRTRQLFPRAKIVQTYACTEAGSSITFEDLGWSSSNDDEENNGNASQSSDDEIWHDEDELDGSTCVGSPPPHIRIGIFDAKANTTTQPSVLPHGKMGIIGTRGPHVMSGYWNRSPSSSEAGMVIMNPNKNIDDWMLTNDLGYIHPKTGKLFFCGRANDVIRTGGESVLATEVERVLATHEDFVECAVFALPDEKFGETVCAAIVLENNKKALSFATHTHDNQAIDDGAVEEEQWTKRIRKYCAEHQLAGFKRPRRVFVLQALPRNSSGKVLKHAIIRLCAPRLKQMSRL